MEFFFEFSYLGFQFFFMLSILFNEVANNKDKGGDENEDVDY